MILSVSVLAVMIGVVAGYSPNRLWSTNRYPYNVPYDQSFQEGYSLLKHTGSYGPYSNRASYGIGRDPPAGCAVDQVMMLRRHGERFPQASAGKAMMDVVQQMYKNKTGGGAWTDDLEFLNRWQFFVPEQGYFELESFMGPYAGLLESYRHGAEYRTRYGHLWDQAPGKRVPIFVADMERVTQTARKFGEGFFAWNYTTSAAINIISESGKMGANSLTPRCQSNSTGNSVCANLTNYHPQFDIAAARLNGMSPGLKLSWIDIFALMEMSAFELNVRGYSDWANVFTLDEWVAFGYQNDLDFYYCNGPGNADNKAVGGVYINATLTLMNQGPEKAGTLFFSFSHDTNITPVLAALGIPYVEKDLPTDRIAFPNPYTISDIMPMGGHLTIERLACNATAAAPKDTYVRLVLNEAVVPFGACQDGPGYSCSLGNYTRLVQAMLPDYVSTCNVPASQPQYLKFFWEYSNSTDWNYQRGEYIPWQGSSDV